MLQHDFSGIPSELIRITLTETAENILKSKRLQIRVKSACKAGEDNFTGDLFRVTLNNDENENRKNLTHKFILKIAPQNMERRERWYARPCFLREAYVYDKLLPMLHDFELSKGLTEGQCFSNYPKCYRTINDDLSECIMLEDLNFRGFTMIDRYREEITFDHVSLIMESLAKFHAVSFALKDQQPKIFEEISSPLTESFFFRNNPRMAELLNAQFAYGKELVSGEEDFYLMAKLEKLADEPVNIVVDCLEAGSEAIITHGDSWQNNFMFRYDNNGNPNETFLLDWQNTRRSSPVIDILHFMFCSMTKEFRDKHYDDCLKAYHNSLSTHIRRLGSDPVKLFPYEKMVTHLYKFGKFGLIVPLLVIPILTVDRGDYSNLNETIILSNTTKSKPRLKKLLRDVIVDTARLGYI